MVETVFVGIRIAKLHVFQIVENEMHNNTGHELYIIEWKENEKKTNIYLLMQKKTECKCAPILHDIKT